LLKPKIEFLLEGGEEEECEGGGGGFKGIGGGEKEKGKGESNFSLIDFAGIDTKPNKEEFKKVKPNP